VFSYKNKDLNSIFFSSSWFSQKPNRRSEKKKTFLASFPFSGKMEGRKLAGKIRE
jgi:hypothetical protein